MGNTRYSLNTNQLRKTNSKLLYISTSKYEGDWNSTPHSHHCSELFYVLSGKGSFIVGDEQFTLKENDLVIVNPYIEHTETSLNSNPLEYIVLGIDELAFSSNSDLSTTYTVQNYSKNSEGLHFCLTTMLKEMEEKKTDHEIICQNLLEALLLSLARSQNLLITRSSSKKMTKECGIIKRYIDSHYSENITLEGLASLAHINKYYLVHAFTKYIGLSPINYLSGVRIQEAKSLLKSTDFSISEISSVTGFSSQSYFSQSFKKNVGISPIRYRKNHKITQDSL